jgi:hypothetical protein
LCLWGALGTWAAVKAYPMVWGGVIAAAAVVDALQNTVPFAMHLRGTNTLCVSLEALFIDALMAWEDVRAGRFDEHELKTRRHTLMKLRHETEVKALPNGLPLRKKPFELAETDAFAYFNVTYHQEFSND